MVPRVTSNVFSLVWRGWFAGVLVIFLPLWLLGIVVLVISGSWGQVLPMLGGLLMLPLIAAGQGALIGGLVLLGLHIWPPKVMQ